MKKRTRAHVGNYININDYSVYDKEDNFLFVGTALECSKYLCKSKALIYQMGVATKLNKHKNAKFKVYKLDKLPDE